jgi:PAS domain S-box-containing protein
VKVPKQFIRWSRPHSFPHPSRRSHIGLRTSRRFLDSLIENLPDMVFVKDAESLKFVRFNKASEEILGISQQEMMGKNDYDFFPPDEAKHFIDDDRRVLAGDGVVDIPEEVIQTRHRGARILHTRKIPVFDSDGKPEFLLGISEDITELKKAQEASLRLAREEAALKEQAAIARRLEFLSEASKALGSSLDYRISMEKLASIMVPGVLDWCTI